MFSMINSLGLSILILSILGSLSALSQDNLNGQLGLRGGVLLNSGVSTIGIDADFYVSDADYNDYVIPVSIDFGKNVRKFSAGAAYLTTGLESSVKHAIGLAMGVMNFDPEFDLIDPERRSTFTMLLQNEVSATLSKDIELGFYLDLDFVNFVKADSQKDGEKRFYTNEMRNNYSSEELANDIGKQSMSAFGLSIKVNLFDKKK